MTRPRQHLTRMVLFRHQSIRAALPAYVDGTRIDVLVDIPSGIADATRGRVAEWAPPRRLDDRFWVTVRRGREGCVR